MQASGDSGDPASLHPSISLLLIQEQNPSESSRKSLNQARDIKIGHYVTRVMMQK